MEIHIPHPQLIKTLELISRISTKHVTLPVLQCVVIAAEAQKIVFKATNLEISIEVDVVGSIVEEGIIAVPASTLLQSVQFMNEKEVILKTEEQTLLIEGVHSKTSIKSIPHDEFPTIHRIKSEGFTINRELFALGIKTTAFAASASSIKPELGSIFIQQKKEHSLTFVATDSFRLMEKTVPQKGVVLDQPLLIPQKNATELARVCDLLDGDPHCSITDTQCALQFPTGVYITSRLVSGSFPDYTQIIPKEFVTKVVVLKEDLLKAFKKTTIFLNKFMQVTISVTDKELVISSQNSEIGHTTDSLKAQVDGQELTLSFNQQYVMDPLSAITDDSVVMRFAGIGRPLIIEGVSDTTLRYLVMPMNK